MRNYMLNLLRLITVILLLAPAPGAVAADGLARLRAALSDRDAVLVAAPDGGIVFAHNADCMLIPASTLKLLTALCAVDRLGADFRFKTEFFIDDAADLTIKGFGDPLLTSENVGAAAKQLAVEIGGAMPTVNDLRLDNTYFSVPMTVPGVSRSTQPYDAPNGALCVNFNTVFFKRRDAQYVSAEPQTPLLPMAVDRIRQSGMDSGRITLSHRNNDITRYAGQMFRHFLSAAGLTISGRTTIAAVGGSDRRVLVFTSPHTLTDVVAKMMAYSNNFMANQILLATGAAVYGPPATIDKGLDCLRGYARRALDVKSLTVAEGAGISRRNRMSAAAMMRVLKAYTPLRHTLRRRGPEFYKTGHLNGVRTRVGYIESDAGPWRYVIFINSPGRTAESVLKTLAIGRRSF